MGCKKCPGRLVPLWTADVGTVQSHSQRQEPALHCPQLPTEGRRGAASAMVHGGGWALGSWGRGETRDAAQPETWWGERRACGPTPVQPLPATEPRQSHQSATAGQVPILVVW
jgi:poly(3-hydroxybutyrate) depolymerase